MTDQTIKEFREKFVVSTSNGHPVMDDYKSTERIISFLRTKLLEAEERGRQKEGKLWRENQLLEVDKHGKVNKVQCGNCAQARTEALEEVEKDIEEIIRVATFYGDSINESHVRSLITSLRQKIKGREIEK